ncbi:MAG: thioredoxin domain-containing protein [Sphingosinicella sp.]|nr:thioredoxin domain-containing protein [Sphingosinicella sp.]
MKALIGSGALTLALLLAGCGDDAGNNIASGQPVSTTPLQQVEAPNGDWTQIVSETADGGFMMGNPNAPVKLVEYGSLSCPHCAEFAAEGGEKLKNEYVKSGQVSFEFRPFLLGAPDVGISMLLRCQGPGPFFRLTDQLYAEQRNWMQGYQDLSPAEAERIQALPAQQRVVALTKAGGIDQFFRQRGMPEQKINSCLADPAGLTRLAGITQKAVADIPNFPGTPTFLINGEMVEATASWELLEPKLREAIG